MKFNNKNIYIGQNVKIGKNVKIGDNSVIYDNVTIGDNSIIGNNSIIGEPLQEYYYSKNYNQPITLIGENALIRSNAIIYAGSEIGSNFNTGHFITIRENTTIGNNCIIGTKCDIQGYTTIGNYVRLHSFVVIGQYSNISNYVQIFPFVVLTNDSKPPSNELLGPQLDEYTVIASSTVLLAGIKLGKHCLVGANSVVNKDYDDYSFINGNPAKYVCDVRKLPFFTNGKRHYPWPYNYKKGMPWEEEGYGKWEKSLGND
ncbi:transferase hexapeptide repeat containing protein [Caldithrix abyssi DSM 13497]|uniref:Transferase hexapeptide (Six repeat-containing protein) n=2 Tax=Caldithrix abyssi TaxID=187145 RepID=H1XS56_CALAY|nr:acyltransferase [Caldithrix abyssi]APF20159.1 transferase hexapeptide (six repeat-containing protein) [Caldithrix abyssi DSM 13497]EHO40220.1 transferase hexapeptide repeat containing protein [Caldithrix abyssi DSM 13497]